MTPMERLERLAADAPAARARYEAMVRTAWIKQILVVAALAACVAASFYF